MSYYFGRINFFTDHAHTLGQFSHFLVLHYRAHTCSTFDGATHVNVGTGHVGAFVCARFPAAERGNFALTLPLFGLPEPDFDTSRFFQQNSAGVLVTMRKNGQR